MHEQDKISPNSDLPNAKALIPILWHVIDRWHQAEDEIDDWRDAEATIFSEHRGWAGLAESLQLINTFQWHEEDKSRAHEAGDEIQAAVKRSIDLSNSRRVQQIEKLDALIIQTLAAHGLPMENAPLHSESPASIIDRVTVLALKLYHIREELSTAGGTLDEAFLHARIENLDEQIKDLAGCLDDLFLDIAAGRRGIKLYRQIKVYKDPSTGRYHSGLSLE